MPDTKRQKIVSVIIDTLKLIKTVNGFQTNLGLKIEDWETDWQESELKTTPGTSVCDLIAERDEENSNEVIDYFKMPVQIRTSFSSAVRAADARKFLGDVLKSLKPLSGGFRTGMEILAEEIYLKREGFVLAEDGFRVAATAVEIEISYFTQRFDAYQ